MEWLVSSSARQLVSSSARLAGLALCIALAAPPSEASRRVYLHAHVFDPLTEQPLPEDLATFPATLATGNGSDFFMLQTTGWTTEAWHDEIQARGGEPLGFLRHGCTVVRAPSGTMGAFAGVPTRRATVPLLPAHRLTRPAIAVWKDAGLAQAWPDGYFRVVADFMRDEEPDDWAASIASRLDSGTVIEWSVPPDTASGRHGATAYRCDSSGKLVEAIEELARTPGIRSVGILVPSVPSDMRSAVCHQSGEMPPVDGRFTPTGDQFRELKLYGHGLDGRGEIIGVIDLTFAQSCVLNRSGALPARIDQPWPTDGSPLLVDPSPGPDKVMTHYRDGLFGTTWSPEHGANSASIAAGDEPSCLAMDDDPWIPMECGRQSGLEHLVPINSDVDGTAPSSRLVLLEQEGYYGTTPLTWLMHRQIYNTLPAAGSEGPRIASVSQNPRYLPSGYGVAESDLDHFTHSHRDYLLANSAGNNQVPERREPPIDIKGGVAVGAVAALDYPPGENVWSDPLDPSVGSGHGPGDWFRVKPDVVAWAGDAMVVQEFDEPCVTQFPASGTSAATPTVAGLSALVRQYFRQGFYPTGSTCGTPGLTPTNALLKAMLINSTRNLKGTNTGDVFDRLVHADRPTFGQGWGRPVLGDALFLPGDRVGNGQWERTHLLVLTDTPNGLDDVGALEDQRANIVADMRPGIRQGEIHEFEIEVERGEDLHITLAWTDRAGAPTAADPLVADLDLEVIGPAPASVGSGEVVWRPNPGVSSAVDGSGNRLDRARAWSGGYTILGPAPCGAAPLGDEVFGSLAVVEYEDCAPQPACPPGEPQYRHPQRTTPPFSCFHHRDPVNTVENIFLPAASVRAGTYTLRVIGYEVPDTMSAVMAFPSLVTDGRSDSDEIAPDWQGYALVASGRVSHRRGSVHLGSAHHVCGDSVQAFIVDSNFASGATVQLAIGSDVETVLCVEADCRDKPVYRLESGESPTPENGIVELEAGVRATLTATYVDPDFPGSPVTACSSTGPLVSVQDVTTTDACGDADESADPGELIFVDALIRNESPYPIASLTAAFATGTGGSVPQLAAAVASPLPLLPGQTATLRVPVIVGAAACPGSDNILVQFTADHRACDQEKLSFSLGGDCSFVGVNPAPPEEVPDGSVTVTRLGSVLRLSWSAPPLGADAYNVYRGGIETFANGDTPYSHVSSSLTGAGVCGTPTTVLDDNDDLLVPGNHYYIVTPLRSCGLEGTPGFESLVLNGVSTPGASRAAGGGCP